MGFEEIIDLMENAEDYIDLYDAATYIVDDELRENVENAIGICEDNGDSVEEAYSIVTSDWLDIHKFELNENVNIQEKEFNSLEDYLTEISEISNDKDLLNTIDMMENDKAIDSNFVMGIRQLFKNNRYMPLQNKVDAILKYAEEHKNNAEKEIKTESVKNIDKEDKTLDEIKEEDNSNETALNTLTDRVGQQMSVGEFNKLLQTLFNQFNKLFILESDLYSMDLAQTQTIEVKEDDTKYIISYNIIDVENGIIELVDAVEE